MPYGREAYKGNPKGLAHYKSGPMRLVELMDDAEPSTPPAEYLTSHGGRAGSPPMTRREMRDYDNKIL